MTRYLAALAATTVVFGATAIPAYAATGVITASWGKGSPNFTDPGELWQGVGLELGLHSDRGAVGCPV